MYLNHLAFFVNGMAFMFFVFTGVFLLHKKNHNRIRTTLAYVLLFWSLLEFKDVFFDNYELESTFLRRTLFIIDSGAVAAASFFLLELTMPGWLKIKRVCLLLLPFICFSTLFFIYPTTVIFMGYWVFIVIYSLINVCILIWAARKYKKRIRDYYSYSDNIDISWLGKTIVILFACMIIWLSTNTYTDSNIGDIILYLSTIVFWSYITYHVCLMSKITENAQTTIEETHANAKQLEEDAREEYGIEPAACELLMKVMVEGKLYLNPKLTISEVANAIGTNRTYLSNYFNNTLQTTFYDFINNFRIENASKQLLESTQPLHSIEEVAEQSGFNSVSTFRRAFVKNTGMSPLKFRKSMSNQTVFKA